MGRPRGRSARRASRAAPSRPAAGPRHAARTGGAAPERQLRIERGAKRREQRFAGLGESAADDDHARVADQGVGRQRERERIDSFVPYCGRVRVGADRRGDPVGGKRASRARGVAPRDRGGGRVGLETAAPAAGAQLAVGTHGGVADLAGPSRRAGVRDTVTDVRARDPGADADEQHVVLGQLRALGDRRSTRCRG